MGDHAQAALDDPNAAAMRLRAEGDYLGAADLFLSLERFDDVLVCAREAEIQADQDREDERSPARIAIEALRSEVARRKT